MAENFEWLELPGLVNYNHALLLMEHRLNDIIKGKKPETIFLLEHQEIYSAGTNYKDEEIIGQNIKIPIVKSGRGGKITYHGPGQLIIYPLIDLRNKKQDIKHYIRFLETWIINVLKQLSIDAYIIDDMVGVWVNINNVPNKIAAIGIRARKWVTYHGIAVNISNDLLKYNDIIPCGIKDFPVTSLYKLKIEITKEDFNFLLKEEFIKTFYAFYISYSK